jgi:hypothetical protein
MARVNKIDEIVVDDPTVFENVAMILLRDDNVIELYAVAPGGLEHYVGRLDHNTAGDVAKIRRLIVAIRQVVKEKPFSQRSCQWLSALKHQGLLELWEAELS